MPEVQHGQSGAQTADAPEGQRSSKVRELHNRECGT
eukprot:CAMPEP_0197882128 /NCGR_PEP_ID=MMETSP1439-20131203/9383_1 /TAXON_ID=66791 /ORGANISM="Gonyaulax spinifera, Strain CCMP409" /LENGTH=35 /DNA_ID= /DNA_START= /DNA_END= /DNA_ORIENTATION=